MENTENLSQEASIQKLKELVKEISICLFCTNLKSDDDNSSRPMGAQKVCDQGNIWFFSEVNSNTNKDIMQEQHVKLFFAHPDKSSYLIVNGRAEIVIDKKRNEELWSPLSETWFKNRKGDSSISIIKVKPQSAYYWDKNDSKMINFLRLQ